MSTAILMKDGELWVSTGGSEAEDYSETSPITAYWCTGYEVAKDYDPEWDTNTKISADDPNILYIFDHDAVVDWMVAELSFMDKADQYVLSTTSNSSLHRFIESSSEKLTCEEAYHIIEVLLSRTHHNSVKVVDWVSDEWNGSMEYIMIVEVV